MAEADHIESELVDGRLLVITLHSLRGLSFDLALGRALAVAVSEAAAPEVGAVLIRSTAPNFCLGGDLRYFALPDRPVVNGVGELVSTLHEAVLGLRQLPVPVIAELPGWSVGAGIGLALSADVLVATTNTKFKSAYTAIAFTPDLGLSWHLPRLIGEVRAAHFFLTNCTIDGSTALEWGLVSLLASPENLESEAMRLALELAEGPRAAQAGVRSLVRGATMDEFRAHLDREARLVTAASESPEGRRRVQEFLTTSEQRRSSLKMTQPSSKPKGSS